MQIVLGSLCIIAKSDSAVTVGLVGEGILFTLAAAVGAATVAPIKYMWWFASATFGVLIIITLLQRIPEGSHEVSYFNMICISFLTIRLISLSRDDYSAHFFLLIYHAFLQVHKNLTYLTVAAVAIYGVLWLLGSEGTAALGLSQEVK